jgi:hypothetical protein
VGVDVLQDHLLLLQRLEAVAADVAGRGAKYSVYGSRQVPAPALSIATWLYPASFDHAGVVERTGRGINRMFAEQLRVGRPAPDYGRSSDAGGATSRLSTRMPLGKPPGLGTSSWSSLHCTWTAPRCV